MEKRNQGKKQSNGVMGRRKGNRRRGDAARMRGWHLGFLPPALIPWPASALQQAASHNAHNLFPIAAPSPHLRSSPQLQTVLRDLERCPTRRAVEAGMDGEEEGLVAGAGMEEERAAARSSPRLHPIATGAQSPPLFSGTDPPPMCASFGGAAGEKSEGEEAAEGSGAHGARCGGSGEAAAGLARGIGLLLPRSRLASTRCRLRLPKDEVNSR